MTTNNTYKNQRSILSFRVARELIRKGHPVIDFATSNKFADKVVIQFEATPEFEQAFDEIMQEINGGRDDRI